jgi:peptidoglycan hydrolase CwlO-like protein
MADEAIKSLAVKLALDNGTFKQGVNDLKQSINVIDSGFKASVAGVKNWGKSIDALKANATQLTEKIKVQKQIVDKYGDELGKAKTALDKNSAAMLDNKKRVDKATEAYEESVKAKGKEDDATKELKKELDKLTAEYKTSENLVKKNASSVKFLTVEYNKAQGEVNKLENDLADTTREIKQQDRSLDGLKSAMKSTRDVAGKLGGVLGKGLRASAKIGIGALAGMATILGGVSIAFKKGVEDAINAEKYLAQLDAVLKSTGGAAGVTKEQVTGLAEAMEQTTKFSAEDVLDSSNLLLTFTKISNKVFPRATEAIADMSTAMGTDLKGSTIQVGKALNDPIKGISALTRVGVQFTDQQKDQIKQMVKSGDVVGAQTVILKELETQFGGSAEAAGKTLGGQLIILKNAFGAVGEAVVGSALPMILKFTESSTELFKELRDNIEAANGDFPTMIKAVGDTLGKVVAKISEKLPAIIDGAFEIVESIVDALTTQKSVDSMIDSAVLLIDKIVETLDKTLPKILEAGTRVLFKLVEGLLKENTISKLISAAVTIITFLTTEFSKPKNVKLLTDAAIQIVTEIANAVAQVAEPLIYAATEFTSNLITELLKEENLKKLGRAGWEIAKAIIVGIANIELPGWLETLLAMAGSPLGILPKVKGVVDGLIPQSQPIPPGPPLGTSVGSSKGRGVAQYNVGTRYLPSDMLVQAHKGEMIVPKSENPYANSGGRIMPGGVTVTVGTLVGSNGMKEFADILSKTMSRGYGLQTGGAY